MFFAIITFITLYAISVLTGATIFDCLFIEYPDIEAYESSIVIRVETITKENRRVSPFVDHSTDSYEPDDFFDGRIYQDNYDITELMHHIRLGHSKLVNVYGKTAWYLNPDVSVLHVCGYIPQIERVYGGNTIRCVIDPANIVIKASKNKWDPVSFAIAGSGFILSIGLMLRMAIY